MSEIPQYGTNHTEYEVEHKHKMNAPCVLWDKDKNGIAYELGSDVVVLMTTHKKFDNLDTLQEFVNCNADDLVLYKVVKYDTSDEYTLRYALISESPATAETNIKNEGKNYYE